jgi:Predicted transcriptional regulators
MNELKRFRQSKGMSQEKMARTLDITLSYYAQVERGVALFSREFILKMKRAFPELDINDVFFNDDVINDYLYKGV